MYVFWNFVAVMSGLFGGYWLVSVMRVLGITEMELMAATQGNLNCFIHTACFFIQKSYVCQLTTCHLLLYLKCYVVCFAEMDLEWTLVGFQ